MRLSEAVRLGSMMKPQAFGAYYDLQGSCALGAAGDAVGINIDAETPPEWNWYFGENAVLVACPVCGRPEEFDAGACTLVHLNDDHRWTREQIADWVEQIENEQIRREAERAPAELNLRSEVR